ncbi:MAG: hypothetical protein DHS20C02_15420 [Micavibrio sp.]|nr:MAG: hypothetical protein DHS20C02_15420 [Micavibrio sp.]
MKKQIFALVFLCALLVTQSALACSCIPNAFSGDGSKANIENAAMIFKGTVRKSDGPNSSNWFQENPDFPPPPDKNPNFSKISLEVQELYKGQKTQSVAAYFDTATSCGSQVKEGESGLYILNEYLGALVSADLCGKYIAPEHMKVLKSGGYLKVAQQKAQASEETVQEKPAEQKRIPDVLPEDIEAVPFTENFESEDALRLWAKTSTFGGGYTEKREIFDRNLALVFRSYTSGIPSFDIGIYRQDGSKWTLIKSHPPVVGDQPMIQIVDDNLVILTLEGGEEVLSIAQQDLQ